MEHDRKERHPKMCPSDASEGNVQAGAMRLGPREEREHSTRGPCRTTLGREISRVSVNLMGGPETKTKEDPPCEREGGVFTSTQCLEKRFEG